MAQPAPYAVVGSPLDSRELIEEFYFNNSGRFRANPAVKQNWPVPGVLLSINSTDQNAADVSGRSFHSIQVKGINVVTGDTVVINASLDGINFVPIQVYDYTTNGATSTITADSIYYIKGCFWYLETVTSAGANTGTTNITLLSQLG